MIAAGMPAWLSVIVAVAVAPLRHPGESWRTSPFAQGLQHSALITAIARSLFLKSRADPVWPNPTGGHHLQPSMILGISCKHVPNHPHRRGGEGRLSLYV
jgi:hypothetical protein